MVCGRRMVTNTPVSVLLPDSTVMVVPLADWALAMGRLT
jgi:hypothetical protein